MYKTFIALTLLALSSAHAMDDKFDLIALFLQNVFDMRDTRQSEEVKRMLAEGIITNGEALFQANIKKVDGWDKGKPATMDVFAEIARAREVLNALRESK